MKNSKDKILIILIFALAIVLRLAYTLFLKENYFFYHHPSADVLFYQDWAKEIAYHDWVGKTVFHGMPLYPYFLALLSRITLNHWGIIRLFHLILGSINCIFLYIIAQKIFSRKVAIISSVLMASNFTLVYYDWLMMPVTLLVFLSCVIVYSLLFLDNNSSKREWLILGFIIGLGVLGDGKFIILAILASAYFLVRYRSDLKKLFLRVLFPLFTGILIILTAITLRNKIVGNDFVFISAHSGINLYIGNNPRATGAFKNPDFLRPYHQGHVDDPAIIAENALKKRLKPSEVSEFWQKKASNYILNSPFSYLKLLKEKCVLFLTDDAASYDIDLLLQGEWKEKLDINGFRLILPLSLLGIFIAIRTLKNTVWLNLIILSQFLFTLIFFLISRHRATILPYLIIFESYAILWLIDQVRTRKVKNFVISVLFIFCLFLVLKPKSIDPRIVNFLRYSKSGPIYAERKEYKKAQEQYYVALELQPFDTNTLYNLGNSFIYQGKYLAAINYYAKAIKINPFDVDVTYNMAYAYEMINNLESAVNAYEKVLSLKPQSPDAIVRLAEIYRNQNNCKKASDYYEKLAILMPHLKSEIAALINKCN